MAISQLQADPKKVDRYLRRYESMKADRARYDRKWQLVSDYILPRRDFSITARPNQLRPHRVTSTVATVANSRLAAMLLASWFDPARPFLLPNVKRGLAVAGRDTQIDPAGMDYLGGLEWQVFDHLLLPKAQLLLRAGSMLKEFCAFGCGVLWTGRKRGFGPYFNNRPVQACWWSESEEGVIDTLFYRMMLPVYRVIQRWPQAAALWSENDAQIVNEQDLTPILLACQPRAGGVYGAVGEAKPFEYCVIAEDKKALVEESGYDSFPYSVFRNDPMPGQTYAEGFGCQVLPHVMVLNHMLQAIEHVAEQKAEPPLAIPARMFAKTLDRRRGAVNPYNPTGLGLAGADKAILKLDFTGEIAEANTVVEYLTKEIEAGYMTDWLRLRESGDMTAEEVNARGDLNSRGMASITANLEAPTTMLGDRAMEIMAEEGLLAPGPASIAGAEVDWEYAGPLTLAQLRGNVQSVLQVINTAALTSKMDQSAAEAVDLAESLRVVAEGLGAPTRILRSRAEVAAKRAADQLAAQQQANAEKLSQVAAAAKDGGAGLASTADAMQGAGAPGPAPAGGAAQPFAPVAPFVPGQVAA